MEKDNIIVAIDIGTSKVTTIVGDIGEYNDLHIIGLGETESKGIEKGIITQPKDAIASIRKSILQAEDTAGFKIDRAIINIGGPHLECQNEKEFTTFSIPQKEIEKEDIDALTQKVASKIGKENYEIIHILPKKFILDDENEVLDPVNMVGSKLEADFHIVLDKVNAYQNLKRVIEAANIKPIDFIANSIASAAAVLYPEEKDMGVIVLDVGGGTTDIAVYKEGNLEYTKSLPLGGKQITMDIAHRFKISKEDAEAIKKDYGLAIVEGLTSNDIIDIYPRGSEESIQIERYDLVDTIEARLSEIFEIVKAELSKANLPKNLNAGIVITGGVANTLFIRELAESIFDIDVRIGKPKDFSGLSEKLFYPQYATSIGMLIFMRNNNMLKTAEINTPKKPNDVLINIFKRFINKIKEMF